MEETKKYLGARIQEIRKRRGLKQSELAEKVGIDPKHISKIECGYSYPSLDLLDKLAKIFDIKPSELLEIEHLKDKKDLIQEITGMLEQSNESEIKVIYKVIKDITQ